MGTGGNEKAELDDKKRAAEEEPTVTTKGWKRLGEQNDDEKGKRESEWAGGGAAERRQEVVEGSDSLAEGPRHPLSPGDQSAAKTWSQPTKTVVSPSEFWPPP